MVMVSPEIAAVTPLLTQKTPEALLLLIVRLSAPGPEIVVVP